VDVVVLAVNKEKRRLSLGYKQTSEDPWERITTDHPEGSTVTGRVASLTNYGAFVSLGEGVDGMIHVSDLSWGKKIKHPSQVLKEGDVVEARILKIDTANRKISLGMKQVQPDPWTSGRTKYGEGEVVEVTVNNLTDFGAFAEIEPGLDGLIHVSEIGSERIDKPSQALSAGQKVKALITRLDWDNRKISLSMRAYEERGAGARAPAASPTVREEPEEPISDFGSILKAAMQKGAPKGEGEGE